MSEAARVLKCLCLYCLCTLYSASPLLADISLSASTNRSLHGCSIGVLLFVEGVSDCNVALGDELWCAVDQSQETPSFTTLAVKLVRSQGRHFVLSTSLPCNSNRKDDDSSSYDDVRQAMLHHWSTCRSSSWVRSGQIGAGRTNAARKCVNSTKPTPVEVPANKVWTCSPLGLCGSITLLGSSSDVEWHAKVPEGLVIQVVGPQGTTSQQHPQGDALSHEEMLFTELEDAAATEVASGAALGTNLLSDAAGGPGEDSVSLSLRHDHFMPVLLIDDLALGRERAAGLGWPAA